MPAELKPTLIFDLAETLVNGLIGMEHCLAPLLGAEPADLMPVFGGQIFEDVMCGRLTEDAYLDAALALGGWQHVDRPALKQALRTYMTGRVPGMEELVCGLHRAGYPLVLATDHVQEWLDFLFQAHPFLNLFQPRFCSCSLGVVKRQPGAFPHILAVLARPPHECLFIDDNPVNIQAAARAGIPGICFQSQLQLRAALAERGIFPASVSTPASAV